MTPITRIDTVRFGSGDWQNRPHKAPEEGFVTRLMRKALPVVPYSLTQDEPPTLHGHPIYVVGPNNQLHRVWIA